jgi:hypothetical protein
VVFPEAFAKFGGAVADDAMLLVRGKYERDEETSRLVVSEITLLDVARERAVREVEIHLTAAGSGRTARAKTDARAGGGDRAASRRPSRLVRRRSNGVGPHLRTRVLTARKSGPAINSSAMWRRCAVPGP